MSEARHLLVFAKHLLCTYWPYHRHRRRCSHRRQHPRRPHRRQHHIAVVILVVLIVVMSIIITTMNLILAQNFLHAERCSTPDLLSSSLLSSLL